MHQLQQLLSQLSAAPDLAQFDSADTYSKLRQLAKQHSASNTELLLLQSSALRNGLQLLQQAMEQQQDVPRWAMLVVKEVQLLLMSSTASPSADAGQQHSETQSTDSGESSFGTLYDGQ